MLILQTVKAVLLSILMTKNALTRGQVATQGQFSNNMAIRRKISVKWNIFAKLHKLSLNFVFKTEYRDAGFPLTLRLASIQKAIAYMDELRLNLWTGRRSISLFLCTQSKLLNYPIPHKYAGQRKQDQFECLAKEG